MIFTRPDSRFSSTGPFTTKNDHSGCLCGSGSDKGTVGPEFARCLLSRSLQTQISGKNSILGRGLIDSNEESSHSLKEGKHLSTLDGGDIMSARCFSPNCYRLCCHRPSIQIWDLEGKVIVGRQFTQKLSKASSKGSWHFQFWVLLKEMRVSGDFRLTAIHAPGEEAGHPDLKSLRGPSL
ncbi:hypothetical protein Celaphus_00005247 [Cervus elaphus hippelaphus]|uniref:Uncharacterized protein n=1 Tax=Cervus elaphus hippelaphus TaxID=46360 RepID=A0A212CWX1_CEREH|nr:hypothetical protein Celaphus_00005247 [Cervus elaphus hippelaphus]